MVRNKAPQGRQREILEKFKEEIGKKEDRKIKGRQERERNYWFWLGMFGLVGWSVAVPTLIGISIGIWLDKTYPAGFSWTLLLLIVGIILGCLNAWYWIKKESSGE